MKCSKCQEENDSKAYYCHACGNKLRVKINGWKLFSFILLGIVTLLGYRCWGYYNNAIQKAAKAEKDAKEATQAQFEANQRAAYAEKKEIEAKNALEIALQAQHIAEQRARYAEMLAEEAQRKANAIILKQKETYNIGDTIDNYYKIAYLDYSGKHGYAIKDGGKSKCIVPDISITELEDLYQHRYILNLKGEHWSSTKSKNGKYYTFDFSTREKRTRRKCAGKEYKYLFIKRF